MESARKLEWKGRSRDSLGGSITINGSNVAHEKLYEDGFLLLKETDAVLVHEMEVRFMSA
jgi:hypothetical protein